MSDGVSVSTEGGVSPGGAPSLPAPTAPTADTPSGTPAPDQSLRFGDLLADDDVLDESPRDEPGAPTEDGKPASGQAGDGTPAPVEGDKPTEEAAKPAETPKEEPPPEPQPISDEQMLQFRQEVLAGLENHYTPTDQEMELYAEDPKKFFAQALAKLHWENVQAATLGVLNALPHYLENWQGQQRTVQTAAETFWGRWPDLLPHAKTVVEFGEYWRSKNPNASPDEYLEKVGGHVSAMLGLPRAGTPRTDTVVSRTRENLPPPNRGTSGVSTGQPRDHQGQSSNPWAELAEFEED